MLVEKETVFAEDIEAIFGRSASDERKAADAPIAEPAAEATDEPQSEGDLLTATAE